MHKHFLNRVLMGALLLASAGAHAQYAWIDAKGVRHYSDQPPPTDIPDAKILKTPRGGMPPAPAPAQSPATAAKAAPTLADREADYRKRHAASEEADKKAAADQKVADNKRTNCVAAARDKAELDTGRRLRNETGAHEIMTEDDKARQLARDNSALKDCQ
jgi:hypothetical protein